MNPEDLQKLSKEELIKKLHEFNLEEEQIMATIVMIRTEILARLKDQELKTQEQKEVWDNKMKVEEIAPFPFDEIPT